MIWIRVEESFIFKLLICVNYLYKNSKKINCLPFTDFCFLGFDCKGFTIKYCVSKNSNNKTLLEICIK